MQLVSLAALSVSFVCLALSSLFPCPFWPIHWQTECADSGTGKDNISGNISYSFLYSFFFCFLLTALLRPSHVTFTARYVYAAWFARCHAARSWRDPLQASAEIGLKVQRIRRAQDTQNTASTLFVHTKRGATRTPNWTLRIIRLHLISHLVLQRVVRLVQITAKSQIVLKHVAPPVESFISVFRPKTQLSQLCCANIANVAKHSSVMFINIKRGFDKLNFKFWDYLSYKTIINFQIRPLYQKTYAEAAIKD